ncbi:MAG: class I SAM-dependent methyltransferase [Lentisphaeria bacterium]|nr:class I SAM-dependent methyltransferase [Lentisphaeria bacterium]
MNRSDQQEAYWDETADLYNEITTISIKDFHYGPLLPGDSQLSLLPSQLQGLSALELACGAGQNTIYLHDQGVNCSAMDISQKQLGEATKIATNRQINFFQSPLDALTEYPALGKFDLIHSSYGIPFADHPSKLIKQLCENHLNEGGTFICSLAHPLYYGEWLELDENEEGMFMDNYFEHKRDKRELYEGHVSEIGSDAYPISEMLNWFIDAGLKIEKVLEPKAINPNNLSTEQLNSKIPYYSKDWLELYPILAKVPVVFIIKATK